MARLFHCGAEIEGTGPTGLINIGPDGTKFGSGTVTRDTAVFRSGVASWKFDSTGSNFDVQIGSVLLTFAISTSYFFRAYVRLAAAPGATTQMLTSGGSSPEPMVRLRTDGGIELFVNGATQGSPSASIADSNWHRVELKGTSGATAVWTAAELMLDGVSVATWSGSVARGSTGYAWGFITAPGASVVMNVDDVALNDSTGATNNTYPGDGKVVLLVPTADSAKGTGWTNDAAGTTNFFDALDNTPPAGIADTTGSTGLHQIRNATANANSNYDATMKTYTAAGVGASDTVNAVHPWVVTSAPVSTSAKLGTVGVVSNPAITNINLAAEGTSGGFWGGIAAGTYASGWKWSASTVANAPSVTRGTAPVMRITQVTSSTRIAMVCGMFIYVEYTPAAVAAAAIPDVGMALTVT